MMDNMSIVMDVYRNQSLAISRDIGYEHYYTAIYMYTLIWNINLFRNFKQLQPMFIHVLQIIF